MQCLLGLPVLTSSAAVPRCLLGTAVPSILFLFVPDSQSTLHSWLLGVSGISSYPPSGLGSTLPFAPCSPHALLSYPHNSPLLNTVLAFRQLAVGSCKLRATDLPLLSAETSFPLITSKHKTMEDKCKSLFPWNHLCFLPYIVPDTPCSVHIPIMSRFLLPHCPQ